MRRLISELARFGAVGLLATFIHAVIYLVALRFVPPQVANIIGFACAFAVSYFGHNAFSFPDRDGGRNRALSGGRFVLVSVAGFLTNAGFVAFSEKVMNAPHLGFWFIALVTPALTFLLLKFWVFRSG